LALGSTVAVLAALTCFGSNGISLADPGPVSAAISFPTPLLDKIKKLEHGDTSQKKKALILKDAYHHLPKHFESKTKVWKLSHPKNYQLSKKGKKWNFPGYFSHKFNNKAGTVLAQSGYYDYKPDNKIWVDFAANRLGGGVFGKGMVQEETMALEMPELANAAATGKYNTRKGNPGVLGSNPTPLVLTKVHRTIKLDKKLYGHGYQHIKQENLKKYLHSQKPIQRVDILAVAVEKLKSTKQQKTLETVYDLFNTFVAAYTVAKDAGHTTINTGPIGTGAFHNDREVIYVMQRLAAKQTGVTLRYWDLTTNDQKEYDRMVTKIINKWKKGKSHSIKTLLLDAHSCLAKKC
jgi:hypothetical protein